MDRSGSPAPPPAVALLADYTEEGWPSMDLVADMLAAHLPPQMAPDLRVELVRPVLRRRLSRWPGMRRGWPLDRLLNRFYDYPRFLRRRRDEYVLFHLADHSYSQLVHELPAGRTVVTCHDLDTFRCLWDRGHGRLFRAMTQRILTGLQKAAHVCCDSEATRDELVTRGLVPSERTSVVRLGLRPELTAPSDPSTESRADSLLAAGRDPNAAAAIDILHTGSTIPRKRIDVLLELFACLRQREPRLRLLRVGGVFSEAQRAQARKLGLGEGTIRVLPFLSAMELAAVYRRAALVLLPSEAEGFGLPLIEALACGTPVLASDLPVLREIGGAAVEYAPVADVESWTARTLELLAERCADPPAWQERRARGRQQAAKFSWVETARLTAEVYRRVMALL